MYAAVFRDALEQGKRVHPDVKCYVQCGSQEVKRYCEEMGHLQVFQAVGAVFIEPSCGACINAGPGVSYDKTTVTISAINRNFPGRSGPGQLYLASPYTTAASAIAATTVSPAPVTSNTSRATVGRCVYFLPRSKRLMPSDPRVITRQSRS